MSADDINDWSVEKIGKTFPVNLVDFKPKWKSIYMKETKIIMQALPNTEGIRLFHIGSTAMHGIKSKDTIDILLEVPNSVSIERLRIALGIIEYHAIPQPDEPPPSLMFAKGYTPGGISGQTFHLHLRYPEKHKELIFLNFMNSHPILANKYEQLKLRLAEKHHFDREKYTNGKTEFIEKIMQKARG